MLALIIADDGDKNGRPSHHHPKIVSNICNQDDHEVVVEFRSSSNFKTDKSQEKLLVSNSSVWTTSQKSFDALDSKVSFFAQHDFARFFIYRTIFFYAP